MSKQHDVECPVCGTVNKGLYLDETNGWMICEHCGAEVCSGEYMSTHSVRIPLFRMEDIARIIELERKAG